MKSNRGEIRTEETRQKVRTGDYDDHVGVGWSSHYEQICKNSKLKSISNSSFLKILKRIRDKYTKSLKIYCEIAIEF